jgi:aryl-alcohol dehydrogenase-like predicted oxidoreductase
MNAQSARVLEAVIEIAAELDSEPASVALAWLLTNPTVVGPIASARVVDQLPALLNAVSLNLTDEHVDRLTALSEGL